MSNRFAFALAASLLGTTIVTACAPADGPDSASTRSGDRQCFLPGQVNGFHADDDDHVYVTVGANRIFRLELLGSCPDVDWQTRIGIRSRGGGSWVCQGLDAEIVVPDRNFPRTCPVGNVRRLSDEEVRSHRERRRND
ncbi:DUF6491 family protein [Sphingosinicella terrae]|uniref:DUF6491 family protein n=1 Tax=Sphingosinicella terrae TaxID=2172047 RepID=UPI000E0DBE59|nr:DUF6491 family protein [Sphingosinicella terrae]